VSKKIIRRTFQIKAVIWDMDGVIADTIPLHFKVWHDVFQELGVHFTQGDYKRVFGMRTPEVLRNILGENVAQIQTIAWNKEARFRQILKQDAKLLPGVKKLLELSKMEGFKQALASSAPRENIFLLISELEIAHYFDCVVSEEDVHYGKPNPEVFLTAAQRLGVEPQNCLVIEDAVAGVKAAKSARMKCIAVAGMFTKKSLEEADLVIDSLEAVDKEALEFVQATK
jgi:beta-phosphoglucomutase family hydrolase